MRRRAENEIRDEPLVKVGDDVMWTGLGVGGGIAAGYKDGEG